MTDETRAIPADVAGAIALWAAALGLMLWQTANGPVDNLRGWVVILAAAAAAATVLVGMDRGRKKTAQNVTREVQLLVDQIRHEEPPAFGVIR